jgi:DNA mismatch repair ATPase MutS
MEKSYGIEVAKMLNFPEEIIRDAEAYLEFYEKQSKHESEERGETTMTSN